MARKVALQMSKEGGTSASSEARFFGFGKRQNARALHAGIDPVWQAHTRAHACAHARTPASTHLLPLVRTQMHTHTLALC